MSMTPHKRKAQADNEDDVAAEAQRRARSATDHAPSNPSAARSTAAVPSSLASSEAMLARAGPDHDGEAVPSSSSVGSSFSVAGLAAAASSRSTSSVVQRPPTALAPFDRLADVEAQLITQHLDSKGVLALARCSRSLFRCASHSFVCSGCPFPSTCAAPMWLKILVALVLFCALRPVPLMWAGAQRIQTRFL
jgi:hypothetical protein